MSNITISENKRYLIKDNRKFFYLADTCWSIFTNTSIEEWEEYLTYRKMQGFNVLQINILPQWDASESDLQMQPYKLNSDGSFDFSYINEEYFKRSEKMLEMAVEHGFIPALVLLWCNYVPDTWANKFMENNKMPYEHVENYVEYVSQKFSKFNPIWIISGDTDFPSELSIKYYETALNKIKELCPKSLTTLHLQGRLVDIPERLINNKNLGFYMYQSGHNNDYRYMAYEMAENFYNKDIIRPVINSEPCYEQMGFSRKQYGRFTRFDVRKAAWQSLLSGANAGITYGAHGIWCWHKSGKKFGFYAGEGFDKPYDWREALRFDGAWDYAYAKWIFEAYDLISAEPIDILKNHTKEIRVLGKADLNIIVIYIPINTTVKLNKNLQSYEFKIIDLKYKNIGVPKVSFCKDETIIEMHEFSEDVVIIAEKY